MRTPKIEALPIDAQNAARSIAQTLHENGFRAWIVGGAVRDLALGLTPKDVDMASAATPDQISALFDTSHEVGRAFGTVVLLIDGVEVQLTTYRVESGYSDSRRPDAVEFGTSLLEDAKRRDFRCNAIYLDPLTDEVMDPEEGLIDIEAGLIRCVGQPELRFREDGLRLLRMARFAARFGFELDPDTRRAAYKNRAALVGVSAERVLAELTAMLGKPGSARAFRLLLELDLLEQAIGDWKSIADSAESRLSVLAKLVDPPGPELGFAVLFGLALPLTDAGSTFKAQLVGPLQNLCPSKRTIKEVSGYGEVLLELFRGTSSYTRADSIRLIRREWWSAGLTVARAWFELEGRPAEELDRLETLANSLGKPELFPPALLSSRDLIDRGVKPGPMMGQLLLELEDAQLNQSIETRESAEVWLAKKLDH